MSKNPTAKDVAALAGCSQTTVSFVLSHRKNAAISETTRRRVLDAAQQLNYIPNQFAKGLKTNRSNLIGVISPSMSHPAFQMQTQIIEEYAALLGYNVIVCNAHRNPERELLQLRLLLEKSVDGVIFTYVPSDLNLIKEIARNIEIIVFADISNKPIVNMICHYSYREGCILAEHLISLGHQHIACISTPFSTSYMHRQLRENGIKDTMQAHGLHGSLIIKHFESTRFDSIFPQEIEFGFALTKELLRSASPTAIIGTSDLLALGAVNYILTETDLKIPSDISICGFNDIYLSSLLNPKLTTVNHNFAAGCRAALDLLITNLGHPNKNEPNSILIDSKLVVRNTTGPILR